MRIQPRPLAYLAVFGVFATGVGVAYATQATSSTTTTVINACQHKQTGAIRVVAGPGNCTSAEIPISWNVQGPPGDTGATGPTGASGPPGPQGSRESTARTARTARTALTVRTVRTGPASRARRSRSGTSTARMAAASSSRRTAHHVRLQRRGRDERHRVQRELYEPERQVQAAGDRQRHLALGPGWFRERRADDRARKRRYAVVGAAVMSAKSTRRAFVGGGVALAAGGGLALATGAGGVTVPAFLRADPADRSHSRSIRFRPRGPRLRSDSPAACGPGPRTLVGQAS